MVTHQFANLMVSRASLLRRTSGLVFNLPSSFLRQDGYMTLATNSNAAQISGPNWINRYRGSVALADLSFPFRSHAEAFVDALRTAGARVSVAATRRPPERAYLMHWAWKIANGKADPGRIPAMHGVPIIWDHKGRDGRYSNLDSIAAAKAMVRGFQMQRLGVAPSLKSRHTAGLGIDMTICWGGTLSIVDATGETIKVETIPRTGMNRVLHRVGATYGVIKYSRAGRDEPHWSDNGA